VLPSSRNWPDGYEDQDSPQLPTYPPIFMWSPGIRSKLLFDTESHTQLKSGKGVLETRLVLIGLHGVGAIFLQCNFPKRIPIGTLVLSEISMKNNILQSSRDHNANCTLYTLEEDSSIVLVICGSPISAERAFEWNSCLFQHLRPQRVLVFDSLLDSKFIPSDNAFFEPPLIRQLTTSIQRKHQEKQEVCPYLEAPNFVDKVPAAILQHCELRKIDAALFLSLEDSRKLEVVTLTALDLILTFFDIHNQSTQKDKYSEAIEHIQKTNPLFL